MNKIPFIKSSANVPVVEFQLADVKGYALLDTGSEVTIFDKDFVKNNKQNFKLFHDGNIVTMIGLYAEHEDNDFHVSTSIRVSEKEMKVKDAMLADLKFIGQIAIAESKELAGVSAIIGCDTLHDNKVKIDFKNEVLIF